MSKQLLVNIFPGALAVIAVVCLVLWRDVGPGHDLRQRLPSATNDAPAPLPTANDQAPIQGKLTRGPGVPADLPGAWPRFRGASFDAISNEDVPLAKSWGKNGPPVLWTIDLGEGHAGAAVWSGRVYVLDYDREAEVDMLRCLSLADGRDIWRFSYPVRVKRNHGMSRTVPTITPKYAVSLGPKGHVICLDATSGEFLWSKDLVREFGAKVPPWYAGQCPLIDGERAILAPGGDEALLIAVECATGRILWKTPNPQSWKMSHSSVLPMEFGGLKMYVYCAGGGVVGVSAADGSIIWQTDAWRIRIATVPSPVVVGDGRIFLSGGYNAGSMMIQLKEKDGEIVPEPVFRLKSKVFGSAVQTPILYQGYLYGVRPDGQLVCLGLDGKLVWTSGSAHRFGLGSYIIAKGLIYVVDDEGVLTLAEATPKDFRLLARAKVLPGHDAWGPMALAGGRLILRDFTHMACLDVREE